jgi:hypothetical protein
MSCSFRNSDIFNIRKMDLKIATYNVHDWFDDEGDHNLDRVLDLYRKYDVNQTVLAMGGGGGILNI